MYGTRDDPRKHMGVISQHFDQEQKNGAFSPGNSNRKLSGSETDPDFDNELC